MIIIQIWIQWTKVTVLPFFSPFALAFCEMIEMMSESSVRCRLIESGRLARKETILDDCYEKKTNEMGSEVQELDCKRLEKVFVQRWECFPGARSAESTRSSVSWWANSRMSHQSVSQAPSKRCYGVASLIMLSVHYYRLKEWWIRTNTSKWWTKKSWEIWKTHSRTGPVYFNRIPHPAKNLRKWPNFSNRKR